MGKTVLCDLIRQPKCFKHRQRLSTCMVKMNENKLRVMTIISITPKLAMKAGKAARTTNKQRIEAKRVNKVSIMRTVIGLHLSVLCKRAIIQLWTALSIASMGHIQWRKLTKITMARAGLADRPFFSPRVAISMDQLRARARQKESLNSLMVNKVHLSNEIKYH